MAQGSYRPDEIDTSKPHSARVYDYLLGGKNHYPADARTAEESLAIAPSTRICALINRNFMHRATRWLVAQAGIRQFLDVGTGIPTEPNLHQIAQEVAPESRVVYADNDPIVLTYAQALLRSSPQGRTVYLHADVKDPESVLTAPELHETLDMSAPVALSLNAVMHHIRNEERPHELVSRLVEALAPGSYLVLTHITPEFAPERWAKIIEMSRQSGLTSEVRPKADIMPFFAGLELVDPGVVLPNRWKPDPGDPLNDASDADISLYVGVARKP